MPREPEAGRHGTVKRYKTCRAGKGGKPCPECRDAWAAYMREYRSREPSGTYELVDEDGTVIGTQEPLFE
jgi:hypothetical protein